MKRLIILIIVASTLAFPLNFSLAQDSEIPSPEIPENIQPEEFFRARVLEIFEKEQETAPDYFEKIEMTKLKVLDGPEKGREVEARNLFLYQYSLADKVAIGDKVVATKVFTAEGSYYYIADKYRLDSLYLLLAVFFGMAILFARWKGFTSILGLSFSILILTTFIVPKILQGKDPLSITIIGSSLIAVVAIYLAHGFNKRATIALGSTLLTLGISATLAVIFVKTGQLFGLGSEESFYLQAVPGLEINFQGLLLGGIIIGTLGVLDDITASQAAAVDEISKADQSLNFRELYKRGLSVGHEHIAALINTLALAYAGASLPLFLLFTVNQNQPLWVILNSEFLAEEIVRTLVGSLALVFAVPITTLLAAYFFASRSKFAPTYAKLKEE